MAKHPIPRKVIHARSKAVRPFFRNAKSLPSFYASVLDLTPAERATIVRQALLLLQNFYVHLPLKSSMYAINPLQRLHLLERRLAHNFNNDHLFHREMIDIFASLCDQHAAYTLPAPFAEAHAWLPFKVEACHARGRQKYLVSRVVDGFSMGSFRKGVEILSWNGAPIERALEVGERQSMGGNPAARRALALLNLTARPLNAVPPPDEEWVVIGYRTPGGRTREIRVQWVVTDFSLLFDDLSPRSHSMQAIRNQQVRKLLFAPDVVELARKLAAASRPLAKVKGTDTIMPDVFRAGPVTTRHGTFGYIRIFTFEVTKPDKLVDEFIRLMKLLPQTGLIVDVRDNGGGRTSAAEQLLQLICPKQPIQPEPLYFINTPLTLELCKLQKSNRSLGPRGLSPWIESIQRSMETGATYSAAFPQTDPKIANKRGRLYQGPVIVLTSALSYSATEFFAAGFQDHGGKLLGVDDTTGGGGANARTHSQMRQYFRKAANSPFKKLPFGTDILIAFRRSGRVGPQSGNEIEDFGVTPDFLHAMTPNDILNGNADLILEATRLLSSGAADFPRRRNGRAPA